MLKVDPYVQATLLRKLPGSLAKNDIKKCAHQFKQRAHRHTEIEINDIDGQTVLLRAADRTTLDRDWGVLLEIANALLAETAANETQGYYRDLTVDAGRAYFRPADLLATGDVRRYPDGKAFFTGKAAELLNAVDRLFLDFARSEGATHFYAEPIWETADLAKFGYAPTTTDLCRISHFGASAGERFWQNATCDNVWKSLEGARIGERRTFTAVSTCCRSEVSQYFFLERMQTFRMREIVSVGTPAEILAFRERGMEFAASLSRALGLNAFLENSNDPFFLGSGGTSKKAPWMVLPDIVKIELRLGLYDDKSLACASMNVHGNFFARNLGYVNAAGGDELWTSCIAFGLERWVWAVLVQFGADAARWPEPLRKLVDG